MEWFTKEITKLDNTLIPPGFQGNMREVRMMQETLSREVDRLGELSSAAQGLKRMITTADKLRQSPDHVLYLLKDNTENEVALVGLLKVGRKKLYLMDENQRTVEAEPLCVLDFYVRQDRQRRGYGKKLFQYMLQDQGVRVEQLAVDGPSPKMESFLRKNYGIEKLLRQSNNFAVGPAFFQLLKRNSASDRCTPGANPSPVGRFAAHKPASAIAQVIHGVSNSNSAKVSTAERELVEMTNGLSLAGIEGDEEESWEDELEPSPERPASLPVVPLALDTQLPPFNPEHPGHPDQLPGQPDLLPGQPDPVPEGPSPAGYSLERRDSQLTEKGFLDLKFYHNKLW